MEYDDNYLEIEGEGWKMMTMEMGRLRVNYGEIEGEGWKMMTTMGRLRVKDGI